MRSLRIAWLFLAAACSSTLVPDGGAEDAGADAAVSCPGSPSCPACNNGEDDDSDLLTDYPLDPGCMRREDDDEGEPPPAGPCANGLDDDDDGVADYPDDPGCENEEDADETDPPAPACSNGTNDDGDTASDYPNDPGCADPQDGDETDPCPGAGCPACGNGGDDDGDGATDFADGISGDPECTSASDDDESCVVVGEGFDGAWPGVWVDPMGTPPFEVTRRRAAAHDGRFGITDAFNILLDPSVSTGGAGESASVWTRNTNGDPSLSVQSLHFAITSTSSGVCMLNLADELVLGSMSAGMELTSLASTPVVREAAWYRIEVAFTAAGVAECRVYAEGSETPLATVAHAFPSSLEGPVGVRGFPVAFFDTLEVCR